MTAALSISPKEPLGGPHDVAVRIRGLTKHFGTGDQRVQALAGIDLDIYAGQMTLIVGPSGCGKTTLLSVVAGILDADEGEVIIFGSDVTAMSDRRKTRFRAQSIGFVFQQYNLLPALTAAENAAIPLVIAGWSKAAGGPPGQRGAGLDRHGQESGQPARRSFPAARCSASPSRGPWFMTPSSWSATSRRRPSTTRPGSP